MKIFPQPAVFYAFATLDVLAKAMEAVNPDNGVKAGATRISWNVCIDYDKTMPKFLCETSDISVSKRSFGIVSTSV